MAPVVLKISLPLTTARQAPVLGTGDSEGTAMVAKELPAMYAGLFYAHQKNIPR